VSPRKVINRRVRYEAEHAAEVHEGHPFFPFAMFHDTVVNLLIVLIIVAMAVVWHATAGPINAAHPTGQNGLLGPLYELKANPAVQSTEPRPEWYFLFLFELLRIFKTPAELILATIIIPTIWMVLLVAWPFLDRGRDRRLSRRPWGVALGLTVPACLIALTIAGSLAPGAVGAGVTGVPAWDNTAGGKLIAASGCTSCHGFGDVAGPGNGGAINLKFGTGSVRFGTDQAALETWIAHGANDATHFMPAYDKSLSAQQISQIAGFVAALKANKPPAS
jgi:quinol---cytochrome c reductase cytochrome c subunit, bacillus type